MSERVLLDSSVVVRYLAEDDPPRALAAARLIESDRIVVISGVVLTEALHALRVGVGRANPALAMSLMRFLGRANVEVADADKTHLIAALQWSITKSARRMPDAILASTAEQARCDWIATFDEAFASPSVPSRLL